MRDQEEDHQSASAGWTRGGEAESSLGMAETTRLLQAGKLQGLGLVACGIAHDFNNILTGVMGNIELALNSLAPDVAGREHVVEIEAAARRAAELSKQLLAFAGRSIPSVEPLDLSELVADAKQLIGALLPGKRRVTYDTEDGIGTIEADATQVRQVLLNLITNAAEALEGPYGSITVRTRQVRYEESDLENVYAGSELSAGHYVCLEVSDSGVGIPEEARERLFEPFFTTKPTGTGLGLATVLGIVRRHHGGILVRSEPGEGATFTVLFPRSDKPVVVTSPPSQEEVTWVGSGKVLIVDDEEMVRTVASRIVAALGFEVLTAGEGRAAIQVLEQHPGEIDLALVDLSMPGIDGVETIGRMRDIRRELKTVLMSGYDRQEMEALYPACGIGSFLQKPFDSAQLVAQLREALDSPGEDSPSTGDEGRARSDRLAVSRKAREIETRERKTVLVVAGEPDLRSLVRASLEPHDLHVIEAEDGISALALARGTPPDLLVADQAMTQTTRIERRGDDTGELEATVSAHDRLSTEIERAHYETAMHLIQPLEGQVRKSDRSDL